MKSVFFAISKLSNHLLDPCQDLQKNEDEKSILPENV